MAETSTAINFPGLPEYERTRTTHGVEESVLTDEDKRLMEDRAALLRQREAQIKQETAYNKDVAVAEQELAEQNAGEMQRLANERTKAEAKAAEDIATWKRNVGGAYDAANRAPTPSLFGGGRSTWENVQRAFGAALMGIGDAAANAIAVQQGRAPSSNTFREVINQDFQLQRERIERLDDKVAMARTGLKDAEAAREQMLAQVDARAAATYKRLEALGRARLSAMKLGKVDIDGNAAILEARKEEQEARARAIAGLTKKIQGPTEQITDRRTAEAKPPTPGAEDVSNANRLQNDITKLERTIEMIEKNPDAWNEYRANDESWRRTEAGSKNKLVGTVRAVGQIAGLADIAPEQGLKGGEAKVIHQGMAQTKTGIAKGYGGVITEPDRQAADSELASLNNSAKEQAASLRKVLDLYRKNLEAYQTNRGVRLPGAAMPAATPARANPAGAPVAPGSPEDVNSEAPLPEDPNAASIDSLQPGAKPAAAVPTESKRDQIIRLLRARPGDMRLNALAKKYKITDEDLRGN